MSRIVSCVVALMLLTAVTPISAQTYYHELSPQDRVRLDALARQQSEQDAKVQAELRAMKAKLLRSTPLPDARNPLLGRWRIEGAGRSRKKDDMAQLMGMLNNPGGAMCEMLFGSGITEFKPKTWSSIDSYGDDSLGPIQYRGDGTVVWAVPESKMFHFFGFEFASPDRVTLVGFEGCTMVRASAAAANATTAPGNARAAAASPASTSRSSTALQTAGAAGAAGAVVDGAAFRCGDGSLLHVSFCQGNADDATCKLAELHKPGLQIGTLVRRADIAARVKGCEAGGIRYGADDKPVFVR